VQALESRVLLSTVIVTNTNDSGSGSLREAVLSSNSGDTIDFDLTIFATPQTITLTSGEIDISHDLTISGPGANLLTVSGNNNSRVFNLSPGGTHTYNISGLTLSDGNGSGSFGGAIESLVTSGTLNINSCVFTGNSSSQGGGMHVQGNGAAATFVNISNTTFTNNNGTMFDGAASLFNCASTLTNCTISGNKSGSSGGILDVLCGPGSTATATITNCTIAGNTNAGVDGGLVVINQGGTSATAQVVNTIFANNAAPNIDTQGGGSVTSQGHNISDDSGSGFLTAAGDQTLTNPLLAPLGSYGGTTPTMALLPGSPAINAGTSSGAPPQDQRGVTRPQGGAVDIGAFESEGFTLAPLVGSTPQSATLTTTFANALTVSVAANNPLEPVNGGKITFAAPASGASATLSAAKATISSGNASVTATANTIAGSYTVTASAVGVASSATFHLTNNPGAAASVAVVSGSFQSTTVFTAFAFHLVVVVKDAYGNPVPGVSVTFTGPATGPSATFTTSPATTDASGQASVTATANTIAGSYSVMASTAGVATPASFIFTNTPGPVASIAVFSGSNQSATIGTAFANPLVVVATDEFGNPVPFASVTFTAPSSGASATITGSPATTGANGQASVTAKANNIVGAYSVIASVAGLTTPATFSLANTYAVVALFDQTKANHSGSTVPITIKLTDALGNNVGSSSLKVTAVSVTGPSGPVPLQSPGHSQPGNLFTFDPATDTYQFNLKTTGYTMGTYMLNFTIGNDPTLHSVTFMIG
jgi:hypothetical protein